MTYLSGFSSFISTAENSRTRPALSQLLESKAQGKISHANELLDICTIALSSEPAPSRAKEILDTFHTIVPFAAAKISQVDPISHQHSTMVNAGYDRKVSNFLDDGFVQRDELYKMMRYDSHGPLRWADTPFNYRHTESAENVFIPAGFDEGFSACLFSPDGRYVGALHTSVEDRRALDDSVMEVLQWVRRLLAPIVDPLLPVFEVRRNLAPEASAFLITRAGEIVFETAAPPSVEGADYAALAKAIYDYWQNQYKQKFTERLWRAPSGEILNVQIICVTEGLLVAVEESKVPYSLSYRELEIITEVAHGKTNIQIANRLELSPLTVAKHLENIREKTSTNSRAEIATKASLQGTLLLDI